MRKIGLLLLTFVCFELLHAQTPFSNGVWHYSVYGEWAPWVEGHSKIEASKDTIINSNTYTVIPNTAMGISHYLREQDGIVHYFHNGSEYTLFDFNAQVGDTVLLDIFNPSQLFNQLDSTEVFEQEQVIINEIKYIQNALDADSLKTVLYEFVNLERGENYSGITQSLLFNNRHTDFSFISLIDDIPTTMSSVEVRCFESDSIRYKKVGYIKACDFSNVSIQEFENSSQVKVYPNPSSSLMEIAVESQRIKQVAVYNMVGGLVFKYVSIDPTNNIIIDVSAFDKALFELVIESEKGVYRRKVWVQ
jgi:hypothetical protein